MQNTKPLNVKNYGSIPHFSGSKLGPSDKKLDPNQERLATVEFTLSFASKKPLVIVEEKLDGSNVGVAKINGELIPLTRYGYPAKTSPYRQHHMFDEWVEQNRHRFDEIVGEGERVVGEWLAQAHGTQYLLHTEAFVMLDYFTAKNKRINWELINDKADQVGFLRPYCSHISQRPIPIDEVKQYFQKHGSFHGAIGGPEGFVYRVETERKGFCFLAKYVRPDYEPGKYMKDEIFNEVYRDVAR